MRIQYFVRYAAAMALAGALAYLTSAARAEDANADNPNGGNAAAAGDKSPGDKAGPKKAQAAPAKDPTASAFALPKGVTLNPGQQAAYDQLKSDKGPALQDAIDDLQNTKGGTSAQAAKKVRDLRAEIKKAVNDIVYGSAGDSKSTKDGSKNNSEGSSGSTGNYPPQYGAYAPPYYGGYYPYGAVYPYPYDRNPHRKSTDPSHGSNSTMKSTGKPPSRTPPPPSTRPTANTSGGAVRH